MSNRLLQPIIKLAGKTRWVVRVMLLALAGLFADLALAPRAPQAQAYVMQAAALVRTLQFSTRVATLSRVEVGSTLTGRVAQVRMRERAQVRRGEAVVR